MIEFLLDKNGHLISIEESSNSEDVADKINAFTITFYEHILKYTHNIEMQTTSWISTIMRDHYDIFDLYNKGKPTKKQLRPYLDDMSSLYAEGMRRAAKKNPQVVNKYTVYKAFSTLDDICDKRHLLEFLRDNANRLEAKEKAEKLLHPTL